MLSKWGTNAWFSVALIALFVASAISRDKLPLAEAYVDIQARPEAVFAEPDAVYFEDMISAMERTAQEVVDLSSMAGLSADRVQTVEVEELVNGNDETSQLLEETMMARGHTIHSLRQAISTRAEVLLALHEQAFEVSRVVALDVRDDGSVVIFCK